MAYRYQKPAITDTPAAGDWWTANAPPAAPPPVDPTAARGTAANPGTPDNPGNLAAPPGTVPPTTSTDQSGNPQPVVAQKNGVVTNPTSLYGRTDLPGIQAYVTAQLKGTGREADAPYWVKTIQSKGGGGNAYWDNLIAKNQGGDAAASGGGAYQSAPSTVPPYVTPATPDWLKTPYKVTPFEAPTGLTEQNDPGYQARLALADQGQQRGAAASGTIGGGGFAQALAQYNQDYASNEFGNVYSRAVNTWGQNQQTQLGARQQQVSEFQNTVGNANNQYGNQYASYLNDQQRQLTEYLTNYNVSHTAQQDYYNRLLDLTKTGAAAVPPPPA